MATDEKYRLGLTTSAFYRKWLRIWAFLKGTTPTALAGNILQARIEANLDLISRTLKERSEDLEISSDELISRILDDSDDDQEKPTR